LVGYAQFKTGDLLQRIQENERREPRVFDLLFFFSREE
jgi:hypothetical protein